MTKSKKVVTLKKSVAPKKLQTYAQLESAARTSYDAAIARATATYSAAQKIACQAEDWDFDDLENEAHLDNFAFDYAKANIPKKVVSVKTGTRKTYTRTAQVNNIHMHKKRRAVFYTLLAASTFTAAQIIDKLTVEFPTYAKKSHATLIQDVKNPKYSPFDLIAVENTNKIMQFVK